MSITLGNRHRWVSVCTLVVGLASLVAAQRPGSPRLPGGGTTTGGTPAEQRLSAPDTFGLFYFTVDHPNEEQVYSDSSLAQFQQFAPARRRNFDYGDLGIIGSPAQPLRYQPRARRGLDLGWHQFDLYRMTGRTLPYYRLQRPFTYLQYVLGSTQEDGYLTTKFSRNFANGLNFTLDYERTRQLGRENQYPQQNLLNTVLATGVWLHSRNGRYDGFLSGAFNTFEREDNGGLRELPDRGGEFQTPASAQIFLQDTRTRHAQREMMLTQYYRFGGQPDTAGRQQRAFTLVHQLSINRNTYLLAAPLTPADTSFYQRFPALLADARGNRNYTRHRWMANDFRLATFRLSQGQVRSERDRLEVGLTHQFHRVQQEPADSMVNNLLLHGRAGFHPSERLGIDVQGQFNLLDQAGDYHLRGDLVLNLRNAGLLRAQAITQLYTPALLYTDYRLTQRPVWQNTFARTLENSVSGSYELPALGLRFGAGYHLLTNYIYFDTTGRPQQDASLLNILQLTAEHHLRVGRLHLSSRLLLQTADADRIRLPSLLGEHHLYYDGRWFRILTVNFGADLRYTNQYQPAYYNPIVGQFHLQNEQTVPFTPAIDLFFSLRVTKFRAFIKVENVNTWLDGSELYTLTARYPYPATAVRIGLGWRLLD